MFDNKVFRYMALGSSIGTALVGPVVVGIFSGTYFDRRFGTDPWLALLGIIIGLTLGVLFIVHIIRLIERSEKP